MKKKLLITILVGACLVICFICIKHDNNEKEQKTEKTYYQTVVFKDDDNTLIPIEVDMAQELEADDKYRKYVGSNEIQRL
ncbi:MAG: hypothetical protein V8R85_09925 [Frisingicoccus sp.]